MNKPHIDTPEATTLHQLYLQEKSQDYIQQARQIFKNFQRLLPKSLSIAPIAHIHIQKHMSGSQLTQMLHTDSATVIGSLRLALHEAMKIPIDAGDVAQVRLYGLHKQTPLKKLKSTFVDRFVSIKGTVIRVQGVKPLVTSMKFTCSRCETSIIVKFPNGRYLPPNACSNSKCSSRILNPDANDMKTVDWQKIRVQEINDNDSENGRIPRTIECELTGDLVDQCLPGDVVTVCGTVKALRTEIRPGSRKNGKSRYIFVLYLLVNSIKSDRDEENEDSMDLLKEEQFSKRDLQAVQAIHSSPNTFSLLVNSLCPSIFGNELVKAGLCLALFGGSHNAEKDGISVRSDIHVLVVGDPGLGKSQMLKAAANCSPRGVYVCGNSASTSGLTVTMTREGRSGDYALEAGALVLADKGCCCIDEFDKLTADRQSLLEAMEQQTISIAKAGIICTLSARTSILAAANPVGGHYHRGKTVCENLKTAPALLSRFDLIFILLDKPDESRDQLLSEHVISLHSGKIGASNGNGRLFAANIDSRQDHNLLQSIKLSKKELSTFDPIPPVLVRKYIAYSRKYILPQLSFEAKNVLKKFYLSLRKNHQSSEGTPITNRQLESMIRLCQARARSELREIVTEADAEDIVFLMKESLYDLFSDDFGTVDFSRSRGMSHSKKVTEFMKAVKRIASSQSKSVFTVQALYNISREIRLDVDDFRQFLDILNQQNYILKKNAKEYRLMI